MSTGASGNGGGYKPGGGYRPAGGGISWKTFFLDIPLLASFLVALWLVDHAFGSNLETNVFRLVMCAIGGRASVRMILDPERVEEVLAGRSPRTYRRYGIAGLIFFTALATLSIRAMFFAEGL